MGSCLWERSSTQAGLEEEAITSGKCATGEGAACSTGGNLTGRGSSGGHLCGKRRKQQL